MGLRGARSTLLDPLPLPEDSDVLGGWVESCDGKDGGADTGGEDEVRVTPPEGGSGLSTERGPGAKTH